MQGTIQLVVIVKLRDAKVRGNPVSHPFRKKASPVSLARFSGSRSRMAASRRVASAS